MNVDLYKCRLRICDDVREILEEEKPTHVLVAFDAGKQHSVMKHLKSIKVAAKNTIRTVGTISVYS